MGGVSSGTGLKWNKKFNKAKINSRTFLIFFMMDSLDAGSQKDRPYQSDFCSVGFDAIPRQAREQDRFDPSLRGGCLVWHTVEPLFSD